MTFILQPIKQIIKVNIAQNNLFRIKVLYQLANHMQSHLEYTEIALNSKNFISISSFNFIYASLSKNML